MDSIGIDDLQPEIMQPAQFADLSRAKELSPEKRLLLAVLTDAITCYLEQFRGGSKRIRLGHEARRWIFDDNVQCTFSFTDVCDSLGLDASWLRRGLLDRHMQDLDGATLPPISTHRIASYNTRILPRRSRAQTNRADADAEV